MTCVRLMKSTSSKEKEHSREGSLKDTGGKIKKKRSEKEGQSPAVEEFVNKDYP